MWQSIILLLIVLIVIILVSRKIYYSIFSPIALYFIIWIPLFILYLVRLIEYHPVHSITWFIIFLSFFSFLIGGLTPTLGYMAIHKKRVVVSERNSINFFQKRKKQLYIAILFFSLVGLLGALGEWTILLKHYGSIGEIFTHFGEIRILFSAKTLNFGIFAYLAMFLLAGAVLGGIYLAVFSRRKIIPYLPLLGILLYYIPITARQNILFAVLLYFNAFVLTRLSINQKIFQASWKKSLLLGGVGVILLVLCLNFLWQGRMGSGEYSQFEQYAAPFFIDAKDYLTTLTFNSGFGNLLFGSLISNYAYLTSPFAKLNEVLYLRATEIENSSWWWGGYTFGSINRMFGKLGSEFKTEQPQTESFYTPIFSRPGTYLLGAIYDFGVRGGAILIPYFLGFISCLFYFISLRRPRFTVLSILAILYLVIEMSWFDGTIGHTAPFAAFLILLMVGVILDFRFLRVIPFKVFNKEITNFK
jgi:hypothetical protein